jgi:hypothetical protein
VNAASSHVRNALSARPPALLAFTSTVTSPVTSPPPQCGLASCTAAFHLDINLRLRAPLSFFLLKRPPNTSTPAMFESDQLRASLATEVRLSVVTTPLPHRRTSGSFARRVDAAQTTQIVPTARRFRSLMKRYLWAPWLAEVIGLEAVSHGRPTDSRSLSPIPPNRDERNSPWHWACTDLVLVEEVRCPLTSSQCHVFPGLRPRRAGSTLDSERCMTMVICSCSRLTISDRFLGNSPAGRTHYYCTRSVRRSRAERGTYYRDFFFH